MKTIKTITTILLTIFLASCLRIKPQVIGDISFHFNRCRLHCYDINQAQSTNKEKCDITKPSEIKKKMNREYYYLMYDKDTGKEYLRFEPGNYSLETCDEIIGPFIDDYASTIKPWAKKVIKRAKNK